MDLRQPKMVQILPPLRRESLGLPHIPRVLSRLGSVDVILHRASISRDTRFDGLNEGRDPRRSLRFGRVFSDMDGDEEG